MAVAFIASADLPPRPQAGAWMGRLVTEWLPDGRRFRLLEEFAFVGSSGEVWRALEGAAVDGSCFPSQFIRYIGHPFAGPQRKAAVVYDISCHEQKRGWRETQRMFYEAARLEGVRPVDAKVMYFALINFGPRWGSTLPRAISTDEDFSRGALYIRRHPEISLPGIEQLSDAALRKR
ncbi:MAG: DUF1353 domain-containing protein [Gemmatimonadaceae bacterium]